jgi:hypothetical protein
LEGSGRGLIDVLSRYKRTKKNHDKPTFGIPAEVRIEHLPNINEEEYHCNIMPGSISIIPLTA